jgi:anti-sigma B factor antagonist
MIEFEQKDGKLTCSFLSNMTTEACAKCKDELFGKIRAIKLPVVFDLSKVDYIASIFLGICLSVMKEPGIESFALINVKPNVKKVFKISGIDNLIAIT